MNHIQDPNGNDDDEKVRAEPVAEFTRDCI